MLEILDTNKILVPCGNTTGYKTQMPEKINMQEKKKIMQVNNLAPAPGKYCYTGNQCNFLYTFSGHMYPLLLILKFANLMIDLYSTQPHIATHKNVKNKQGLFIELM